MDWDEAGPSYRELRLSILRVNVIFARHVSFAVPCPVLATSGSAPAWLRLAVAYNGQRLVYGNFSKTSFPLLVTPH